MQGDDSQRSGYNQFNNVAGGFLPNTKRSRLGGALSSGSLTSRPVGALAGNGGVSSTEADAFTLTPTSGEMSTLPPSVHALPIAGTNSYVPEGNTNKNFRNLPSNNTNNTKPAWTTPSAIPLATTTTSSE
jgi:hypothetical protein